MKLLGFKTIPIAFPTLAVHFHKNLAPKIYYALTMSWIGDILLFADKGELYFIAGLIAFLISHVCYIIYLANS
jgi:uncharacterized membrane protein YhhN